MEGVSGLNGIETQQVMSQGRKKGTFPKRAYIYVNLFLYDSENVLHSVHAIFRLSIKR